jgi:hypothetical protein
MPVGDWWDCYPTPGPGHPYWSVVPPWGPWPPHMPQWWQTCSCPCPHCTTGLVHTTTSFNTQESDG